MTNVEMLRGDTGANRLAVRTARAVASTVILCEVHQWYLVYSFGLALQSCRQTSRRALSALLGGLFRLAAFDGSLVLHRIVQCCTQ